MKTSLLAALILAASCHVAFALPDAISDLTVLGSVTEGRVALQWTAPATNDAAAGPSAYLVKYATAQINAAEFDAAWVHTYAQSWTSLLPAGQTESPTLTGLTPGATLYFAVKARDDGGNYGLWFSPDDTGGLVNTLNEAIVYNEVPAQVAGVMLSAANGLADISWTASTEIDIHRYLIEHSSFSSSSGFAEIVQILHPGTTHQAAGLVNGNTHYFRISARDHTGLTGPCSVVAGTVPWVNLGVPSWSDADTLALSSSTLSWSWYNVANESGYRLVQSTSGDPLSGDLPPNTTFYHLKDLTPNTAYACRAEAFNGAQTAPTPSRTLYTLSNPPAGITSAQEKTRKIDLSWSAGGNPSYTRYSIQRSTNGFTTFVTCMDLAQSTTHQDTGLLEGTTYQYRIWSVNNDGLPLIPIIGIDKIEYSTVTTRVPPSQPSLNSNSETGTNDGEIRLQWLNSGDDGATIGERCADYIVKWATYTITVDNFVNVSSFTVLGATKDYPDNEDLVLLNLYPGTTYYCALKARDSANNYSALSNVKQIAAQDKPPQPPSGIAAVATSSFTVNVSWTLPSFTGFDDRDRYLVYRATFSFSAFQANVSTFTLAHPATWFPDTGLVEKTTYYYRVSSLDKGDIGEGYRSQVLESVWPAIVTVRTPDTTPPGAIVSVTALPGPAEGKIDLVWAAPGNNGYAGDIPNGRFRIDFSTDPYRAYSVSTYRIEIPTTTAAGEVHARAVTGLSGGATYYFRLWTSDEDGNWSALSAGATSWAQWDITPPSVVTDLAATAVWRGAVLSWSAPGDDGSSGSLNGWYEFRASTAGPIVNDAAWNAVPDVYPNRVLFSTAAVSGRAGFTVTGLANGATYYFSLKAADERLNWSGVSVTTPWVRPVNHAPGPFNLSAPAENSISPTSRPTFQWNASADSDVPYGDVVTYVLEYSTDSAFAVSVTTRVAGITDTWYSLTAFSNLPEDRTIYWRAWAVDTDGSQTLSLSTYFRVRINEFNSYPGGFSLSEPQNGVIVFTSAPALSWNASLDSDPGDTVTYQVEYAQNPAFSGHASSGGISGLSWTPPALTENATWWWRVRATDGVLSTLCATTNYFMVNASSEAPAAFNLTTPANDARQLSLAVAFSWDPTADPDPGDSVAYNLTCSLSSDFSSVFSTTIAGLTEPSTSFALPWGDNMYYYWKVDAVGVKDGKVRPSNQIRKFYTDIEKQLPGGFTLTEPAYAVTISTTLRPWFFWEQAIDPDPADTVRYYLEYSPNPGFSGIEPIQTGTDAFYQPLNNLLDQTTYYWRVRASGYQGSPPSQVDPWFVFSSTGMFVISMTNSPPQPFDLKTPANAAPVNTRIPSFSWDAALDTDLNEVVVYDILISTSPDFSVPAASAQNLDENSYVLASPLPEDRTYYWKVTARDRKGAETVSASVFSFRVPILTRPLAPAGLKGALSGDEQSYTLIWAPVARNTDGSAIDDLVGYNIYRMLSISSLVSIERHAFVPAGTTEWTDGTIQGGKFYFLIRSIDSSGIESENSLIFETLNPGKLTLISADEEVAAEIPPAVSSELLGENNSRQENLVIGLERRTELELGRTLRVYDLQVRDSALNVVSGYDFRSPVELQFSYGTIPQLAPGLAPGADEDDLAVYWFNGVEFIRVGGYVDMVRRRVVIRAAKPGQYQLRQISRILAFGLASVYPSKVFTPGVAPYDRVLFYVDNPGGDKVVGRVFDLRGEHVADLSAVGDATATTVILSWDGAGVRKGVYIYQIEAEGKVINGTVMVAR